MSHDEAVKAAAEALAARCLTPACLGAVVHRREAAAAVDAAAPILLAAERQRIAALLLALADQDGEWIGPTDPDSILRLAAARIAEADQHAGETA